MSKQVLDMYDKLQKSKRKAELPVIVIAASCNKRKLDATQILQRWRQEINKLRDGMTVNDVKEQLRTVADLPIQPTELAKLLVAPNLLNSAPLPSLVLFVQALCGLHRPHADGRKLQSALLQQLQNAQPSVGAGALIGLLCTCTPRILSQAEADVCIKKLLTDHRDANVLRTACAVAAEVSLPSLNVFVKSMSEHSTCYGMVEALQQNLRDATEIYKSGDNDKT